MNTDDPVVPITALKNAAPKLTQSMSDDTLQELIHDATVNTLADRFAMQMHFRARVSL